jgi:hypothetical protein
VGTEEECNDEDDLQGQEEHHVPSLGRRAGRHGVDLK